MQNKTKIDKTQDHPRISREKKTMKAMIKIYCNHHHKTANVLCKECSQLYEYAELRLSKCPYQENKTTCGKCPIHCYEPIKRQEAKKVMRYSGPRMILHHPIMAFQHIIDGRKKPIIKKKIKNKN